MNSSLLRIINKTMAISLMILIAFIYINSSTTILYYIDVLIGIVFTLLLLSLSSSSIQYLSPLIGMGLPWLFIILITYFPISEYHREIEPDTSLLIRMPIICVFVISIFFPVKTPKIHNLNTKLNINISVVSSIFVIINLLYAINIIYSGYIPLIRGILTGNSGYIYFGISGVSGLLYALSNAFGIMSFYFYITTKNKKYLFYYLWIIVLFTLSITRQNTISLLIETAVIYSYKYHKISTKKLAIFAFAGLLVFQVVGEWRSGDISDIVKVKKEYKNVPQASIWIYSYTLFNILNLDNVTASGEVELFDGSSLDKLIPNIFKDEGKKRAFEYLEVLNFNVSSYLLSIYRDIGIKGVSLFTALILLISTSFYSRSNINPTFLNVGVYAVLYFCMLFSFFTNFWFYLPIIFQIPCIYLFDKVVYKERLIKGSNTP